MTDTQEQFSPRQQKRKSLLLLLGGAVAVAVIGYGLYWGVHARYFGMWARPTQTKAKAVRTHAACGWRCSGAGKVVAKLGRTRRGGLNVPTFDAPLAIWQDLAGDALASLTTMQ